MSSQEENVVDNRPPVPSKDAGSIAAAAFRRGKSATPSSTPKVRKRRDSGVKASTAKSTKSSASAAAVKAGDEDSLTRSPPRTEAKKRKRQSTAPTGADESGGGGSGGAGRGRGSGSGSRSWMDEDMKEDDSAAPVPAVRSAIESATSEGFVPARLSTSGAAAVSVGSASQQPLVFFQFPAKFDVAAFSSLKSLSLPAQQNDGDRGGSAGVGSGVGSSKVVSHFELHGERFNVVEGDIGELNDLINLFPSSSSSRGELRPGRPFSRFFRIVGDVQHSVGVSSASGANVSAASHHLWPHSAAAVQKKERKAPKEGLRLQFRPVGFIQQHRDHLIGSRRGRDFSPYDAAEGGEAERKQSQQPLPSSTAAEAADAADRRKRKEERKRQKREAESAQQGGQGKGGAEEKENGHTDEQREKERKREKKREKHEKRRRQQEADS